MECSPEFRDRCIYIQVDQLTFDEKKAIFVKMLFDIEHLKNLRASFNIPSQSFADLDIIKKVASNAIDSAQCLEKNTQDENALKSLHSTLQFFKKHLIIFLKN